MKQNCLVVGLFVLGTTLFNQNLWAGVTAYDLAADWSDASNPNGVWSYNGVGGGSIATNLPDWDPNTPFVFDSAQPAWAAAIFYDPGHVPMWFKRTSDSTILDIPLGRVGMHGAEGSTDAFVGVSWTSPIDGTIEITGGVWQAIKGPDPVGGNHFTRNSDWRIRINDSVLTSGNVSGADSFTSSSPFNLLTGSGGSAALTNLPVSINDVITLEFISPTSFATFVGVDLTITADDTPPTTPIATDIKPTSCPNPLNVKSKGVLPVAILGTSDFDVTKIDLSSLRLLGVAPLRSSFEDVATPFEPFLGKETAFDCTEDGADGYLDLSLKFDTQEIVEALDDAGNSDVLVLPLTGTLANGTPIEGEDVVSIKKPGK